MKEARKPRLADRFKQPEGWVWHNRLETRAGQHLRAGWIVPPKARAIVAIFPGLSAFIEKYFEVAHDLLSRNLGVACVDWRGQGLSWRRDNRSKRYHDDFANDAEDARAFLNALPMPNLPRILLGHSMGGHIGLRLLHETPDLFRCAVLAAPMLGLHMPEWLAGSVANVMRLTGTDDHYMPTHGPWSRPTFEISLRILTSDPDRMAMQMHWMDSHAELRMGGLTTGWVGAALDSIRWVREPAYLEAIRTPCLIVQSGREFIVSNAAITAAAENLPRAETMRIDGSLHEVMMEKDEYRDRFWQGFDTFIAKHVRSR